MNKYISIILLVLGLVSCTPEDSNESSGLRDAYPLTITATIGSNTRASIIENDDQWSYSDFTNGDEMGFYSPSGNFTQEAGQGAFTNQQLIYDAEKKQFNAPDGATFSPTHMSNSIFMYYPYGEGIGGEQGMELRRYKDNDSEDTLRCVDLLTSNEIILEGVKDGKDVALFGTFNHAFAELIIMRGEGFDHPPLGKERITVVLTEPYTHIQVKYPDDSNWPCYLELVYNEESVSQIPKDKAKEWDAWYGGKFFKTTDDKVGEHAWYVVLPTLGSVSGQKRDGKRSYVEYVEICDNDGYWHHVPGLKLSEGNSKYIDGGWRYPIQISMKELVPTVSPYTITPWGQDINLTDERKRGINNLTEFQSWIKDYNLYLENTNDEYNRERLRKYGDMIVSGENVSWHFYVLTDIDLSDITLEPGDPDDNSGTTANSNVIIPQLNDILDGTSTTYANGKFANHTITGLNKTFINKMGPNGSLQNFDIKNPEIYAPDSTDPIGIITNTMDGASVTNCNIYGAALTAPNAPAGMIVGKIYDQNNINSTISGCTLSGFLITGSVTDIGNKIVGIIAEGSSPTFDNNDTTDINEE